MALRRRRFLKVLATLGAAAAWPLGALGPRAARAARRVLRLPPSPGKVEPLEEKDVARPAPWAG